MSEGKIYTGGAIIGVMFSVLFGGFSLGGAAPHFIALNEAKVAGKMAMDVINHIPSIDTNDKTKTQFDPSTHNGDLVFEKVTFRYPTKADVTQLTNLSLTFKRGQTTALVGESGSGKSTII